MEHGVQSSVFIIADTIDKAAQQAIDARDYERMVLYFCEKVQQQQQPCAR